MNVLVIEDHPGQLKLANHVLTAAGHEVTGVVAAEEAFLAIKESRPEIILLDLILPGMDGLALAGRLKADPETADIPIVAVTAFPEEYSRETALNAGCDAYLIKPISTRTLPDDLTTIVRAAHRQK